MYIIRDNEGRERGRDVFPVDSIEEAIEHSKDVDMSPEHPEEYPFSVVNKRTGEVVHQWHLPSQYI